MYKFDNTEEFIQHYGVKGMKWGVRRRYDKFKSKSNAKKLEKKDKKKDKKWEGEAGRKLMDKYGADDALRKEVFSKAAKTLEKMQYATNADSQNLTTRLYAEAINKRLANDPAAKSPSGNKRVKIEIVSANGSLFLKPVVQEKIRKG